MERVIVTGANGFLGSMLAKYLSSKKIKVYGLVRKIKESHINNDYLEYIEYDLSSKIENLQIVENIDCIFHFAWQATSGEQRGDIDVQLQNIKIACKCIDIAKKFNCKRIIYAASISEFETYEYMMNDGIKPSSGYIYGTAKIAAHFMSKTFAYQNKVDFIPLIISNIYGVGEISERLVNTTIKKLLNNEHCSFTKGNQTYDFIYIDDAIEAIFEIGMKGIPYHLYYIGSKNPQPLKHYLIKIRDLVNRKAELGFGEIEFNGTIIDYDQFDLNKVFRDTGFRNRVSFEEGIKKTIEFLKEQKHDQTV